MRFLSGLTGIALHALLLLHCAQTFKSFGKKIFHFFPSRTVLHAFDQME